ncbi:MAG: DNA-binding response regulator [Flavobacteriales bacterium]|nr:MAG: DNA-binding response regulator [Flavobacteriales bacterium]
MIKAVIVDDTKANRDTLEVLIKKYCPELKIVGTASNIQDAEVMIETQQPKLVFLDIEMPGGTGFDLLERLDIINFEVIFVTAYDKYAIRAFQFSAIDYLLKPINIKDLIHAVHKITSKERLYSGEELKEVVRNMKGGTSENKKLAIASVQGLDFVPIKNLIRCEADGKYTLCVLEDGKRILSSKNLKEFETILSEENFYRVHHSHLINMTHIKRYAKQDGGHLVMINDDKIGISQRKKEDFLKRLNKV